MDYDTPESGFSNPLVRDNPLLTPLEQEVLDEYTKLLENMNKVRVLLVKSLKGCFWLTPACV